MPRAKYLTPISCGSLRGESIRWPSVPVSRHKYDAVDDVHVLLVHASLLCCSTVFRVFHRGRVVCFSHDQTHTDDRGGDQRDEETIPMYSLPMRSALGSLGT